MDPVEELRTIEDIRQVKYRYLRCVDTKLWDEIGDTFTAEAKGDLDGDGVTSSFTLTGTIGAGDMVTVSPVIKETNPDE